MVFKILSITSITTINPAKKIGLSEWSGKKTEDPYLTPIKVWANTLVPKSTRSKNRKQINRNNLFIEVLLTYSQPL